MDNFSTQFKKAYNKASFGSLPKYEKDDLNFSSDQTSMNNEISKTKKKIESNEDKIPGGLSKGMSLKDIEKKHGVNDLKKELKKGIEIELEHTDSDEIAKEIAMDHLFEDPKYYTKIEKIETKEATTAGSSGGFEGLFGSEIKKNNLFQPGTEVKIVREEEPEEEVKKVEAKEATTSASSGQYDVPFGSPSKNPLSIDGKSSIKKRVKQIRSTKFPMYGGGGKFVEPNEKCKTFPYCNQGDINALVFSENRLVKQAINNISKKYKLNKEYIKSIIFENVDIYYKNIEMNKEIENIIDTIVERVLNEEIQNKAKQITESVSGEIDEMEEFYEIAKMRKEERMAKKVEATESEIDEDELGEAAYEYAAAKAKVAGKENFDFGGETHDVTMDLETAKKIVGESKKTIKLTEEEIIDLIEKIVNEEKIEGTGQQEKAMKETKKINDSHAKEIAEKMSKYVKDGSKGKFEENPTDFP